MKPDIPKILPEKIPLGYGLGVDSWSFLEEQLKETLPDGTRKLLTLDISISPDDYVKKVNKGDKAGLESRANDFYGMICPNNCPGCFEKGYVENELLSFEDVKKHVIEPAIELGLEFAKFLGPGELIANPNLFKILDYFQEKDIKIGIFTKGGILGDDELSQKYQGIGSEELIEKLCSYDVIRVLIDCRTFDDEKANKMTHSISKNYAKARNRTIELLAQNGMNSDLFNQKMSLQTNPVTDENIDEILEIFKWSTERNIPVFVTPTMISGRGRHLVKNAQKPEFQEKLMQLYTDIYLYLIDRGIMSLEQLEEEGVSSYAGTTPCNQLSCGLYIRKDGVVQRCPGNDQLDFIESWNVREKPLKEIWKESKNYTLGPIFNNKCVKDGYSIPSRLYDEVLKRVEEKIRQ